MRATQDDLATQDSTAVEAAREIVAAISRLRRRIREVSGTGELTPSQTSVLGLLAKSGPATTSSLAASEGVRSQSMAATLAALDERGLIQRHDDPSDGRRQLISLTEAGDALFSGNLAARQEWLVQAMQRSLTPAERQTLIDAAGLLQRLTRA